MSGLCRRCGKCCLYVPYKNRLDKDPVLLRCPHLVGEIGKITVCAIYNEKTRLGTEIDWHVFCGIRDPNKNIPGCTYFQPEHIRHPTTI